MAGIGSPRFELIDHHGNIVDETSFRPHWMLVYFGFTHCKVVCPRSLAKLKEVLDELGPALSKMVKPLYVTVDPERDTPERMKSYLENSYPQFLGLTGSADQVDAAKKAFRVFAQKKADPDDPEGYDVPHSAITYLVDPSGDYTSHWADVKTASEIVQDLGIYLADPD